jgi:hypothetical protein
MRVRLVCLTQMGEKNYLLICVTNQKDEVQQEH